MAKHPQSSPRGLLSKAAIMVGSTGIFASNYSDGTAVITSDSTGVVSIPLGLTPSGQANAKLTGNSTGLVAAATIFPSGGAIGITANSTGVVVPVLYVGAMKLSANSTGLVIGASGQINTG